MIKPLHGAIHGRTIELTEDPGVGDGQEVEIILKPVSTSRPWGEGLRRCAGAFAADGTEDDDRILEEIYRDRKRDSRKEIPE